MPRAARIACFVLAGLVFFAALTVFILLRTPAGHAALKPVVAGAIARQIGGNVSIATLGGALPQRITLTGVAIKDEAVPWLTIDRIDLSWRPLALLQNKTDIDLVHIDGARLLKPPPENEDRARPRGFELPERLPSIQIGELKISNVTLDESFSGDHIRLDGVGNVAMGGGALDVVFNAASSAERDYISIRVHREGDALIAEATIAGKADGVVVALSGAGGPVFVDMKGDGPLSDYRLHVDADIGTTGGLKATLRSDIETLERVEFDASVRFGERLSTLARYVGDVAEATGAYVPADDGGAVKFNSLRGAIGDLKGSARWRNESNALELITIDAEAAFAPNWRPDLQRYLGAQASLKGELTPAGDEWRTTATLDAALLKAVATTAATDLKSYAKGPAEMTLEPNPALPPAIRQGAAASGDFHVIFKEGVSATGFQISNRDKASFRGDATYRFADEAFTAKGDVSAPPAALATINPDIKARSLASGVIDINGTPRSFSGTVVATTPALLAKNAALPPSRIALAFTDAPDAVAGKISIRALDASRRLEALFSRSDGAWRARGVDYAGRNFSLKGSGGFNPLTREASLDLVYAGGDDAEPWPGVNLSGAATAKGNIRSDGGSDLAIHADALTIGAVAVSGVRLVAKGPADRLAIKANAEEVAIAAATPITALSSTLLATDSDIEIHGLAAEIAGSRVALKERALLRFREKLTVENFRAAIGDDGVVALDGGFGKTRWRGALVIRRAPIAGAASLVDLQVDLDTDRRTLATGSFALMPQLGAGDASAFSGTLRWDGRSVHLTDDEKSGAIDIDLRLPLELLRQPALRLSTRGPLNGSMRFSGRAETIAAFLPVAFQSIEGDVALSGDASGTLGAPHLSGLLEISNGAYTELATGLSIVGIDGSARATAIERASEIAFDLAGAGPGQKTKTITAKGTASIGAAGRLNASIGLEGARFSAGPINRVEAIGKVEFSGLYDDLTARGDIRVRDLSAEVFTPERTGLVDIDVVAIDGERRAARSRAGSDSLEALTYALHIRGDQGLVIRGRGLDSEWRADLQLAGRADEPVVLGRMSMIEGHIDFSSRRFDLTEGSIEFDRLAPNNPSLDIRAERETKSGTVAAITIAGRADAPKITLSSSPALPQEDVMALVLFDKPATELSALQSLQVAEGLAELGGIGPFGGRGVTGATRSLLGLDMLNLELDEADSAASKLTVGKYVADGLFVSATQDARGQNGSVRIEYEIDDSFTVETELRQDGDQTVSANWKHDF